MMTAGDLTIRLTPEERASIEKAAEAKHLPVSTWLRQLALGAVAAGREEEERRAKAREVRAWLIEELGRLPAAPEHADEVERRRREWKEGRR